MNFSKDVPAMFDKLYSILFSILTVELNKPFACFLAYWTKQFKFYKICFLKDTHPKLTKLIIIIEYLFQVVGYIIVILVVCLQYISI